LAKRLEALEAETGMDQTNKKRYPYFLVEEVSRLAQIATVVDITLHRWEYPPNTLFKSARTKQRSSLGLYAGVRTTELQDFPGLVHRLGLGGGDPYEVDVLDPDRREAGPLLSFQATVPGTPNKPPSIVQSEQSMTSLTLNQENALAQSLIAGGVAPAAAYQQARETVAHNPGAAMALSLLNEGEDEDEDNMKDGLNINQLFKMIMAQQLMGSMSARPLAAPVPSGPSPEVSAMREELASLRAQLTQQQSDSRFEALRAEIAQTNQRLLEAQNRRPEGPSEMAVAMQSITQAMSGFSQQQSVTAAAHQQEMMQLTTAMLNRAGNEESSIKATTDSLMAMMKNQIEIAQIKMQEPVQQSKAMAEVLGTMGGMVSAMIQMQAAMSGPNEPPHIQVMREFAENLPLVLDTLIGKGKTRGVEQYDDGPELSSEEQAYLERQRQRQLADARRVEQLQTKPTEADPAAAEQAAQEERARELAALVAQAAPTVERLDLEGLGALVAQDPEWATLVVLLESDQAAAHIVGKRWAQKIHQSALAGVELPPRIERYVTEPASFSSDLIQRLGWDLGRANHAAGGITRYLREHDFQVDRVEDAPSPAAPTEPEASPEEEEEEEATG